MGTCAKPHGRLDPTVRDSCFHWCLKLKVEGQVQRAWRTRTTFALLQRKPHATGRCNLKWQAEDRTVNPAAFELTAASLPRRPPLNPIEQKKMQQKRLMIQQMQQSDEQMTRFAAFKTLEAQVAAFCAKHHVTYVLTLQSETST